MRQRICRCDTEIYALGLCRPCYERELKQRNPEYAERQRINHRAWREANREYVLQRERERERPPYVNHHRAYRITADEYAAYLEKPCGICGKPSRHLDHDHVTGEIRGGLCHRCNLGVAYLEGWFTEHRDAALAWVRRTDDDLR